MITIENLEFLRDTLNDELSKRAKSVGNQWNHHEESWDTAARLAKQEAIEEVTDAVYWAFDGFIEHLKKESGDT